MYSYSEFKRKLDYTYGLSEKDIFYIIGVFFEETNGFQKSCNKKFYNLIADKVIKVYWSDYEWYIDVCSI